MTWTGVLNSRHLALGVRLDWAYGPGEVKILTSSDGSNFEEAACWKSNTRSEVSFTESLMFEAPIHVKAIMVAMRSPKSWGYYGLNSVALVAEPGPFMLVRCSACMCGIIRFVLYPISFSGITSPRGEQCLVTSSAGVALESCLGAIAAGDGREILRFDKEGASLHAFCVSAKHGFSDSWFKFRVMYVTGRADPKPGGRDMLDSRGR